MVCTFGAYYGFEDNHVQGTDSDERHRSLSQYEKNIQWIQDDTIDRLIVIRNNINIECVFYVSNPLMVVLWSQHLQRMASQCRVQITNRIIVPLWSFGQYGLFRVFQIPTIRSSYLRDLTPRLQQSLFFGFHCVTLATMFVKKHILSLQISQYVLRTVSTYYEWYRRWRWGVRQEPVDRDLWTCKVCVEPPEYDGYQSEYKLTLKESYMPVMPPPSPRYVVDSLVITKYRGKYLVTHDHEPDRVHECVRDQAAQLIPSDVRFLCIQYLHPQMKGSPIELTIPPGMMMVGNQLLTPAFVLRLLEHTVGTHYGFIFDLNYTLSVMDSHIRMFNLCSTEFVVLDETTYTIVSQPKPSMDVVSIASDVSEINTT